MSNIPTFDLIAHLYRQREFSDETFGPGYSSKRIRRHIRNELEEVAESPDDPCEWIDIVLLALDGAWRTGASPIEIALLLEAKQTRNEARDWPDWRERDPDEPIEHERDPNPYKIAAESGRHSIRLTYLALLQACQVENFNSDTLKTTYVVPFNRTLAEIARTVEAAGLIEIVEEGPGGRYVAFITRETDTDEPNTRA